MSNDLDFDPLLQLQVDNVKRCLDCAALAVAGKLFSDDAGGINFKKRYNANSLQRDEWKRIACLLAERLAKCGSAATEIRRICEMNDGLPGQDTEETIGYVSEMRSRALLIQTTAWH